MTLVQRNIRQGGTRDALRRALIRDRVNAAEVYARWAGRRLARFQMFRFERNSSLALMDMQNNRSEMLGKLREYGVHELLRPYAFDVACHVLKH